MSSTNESGALLRARSLHTGPVTMVGFGKRFRPSAWSLGATFLMILAICVVIGAAVLSYTAAGRRGVARLIEHGVNGTICGRLVIDVVDEVEFPSVRAHGIRILDPSGKAAIDVARATITVSPMDVVRGRPGWAHADIADGIVYVTEDGRGRLNMTETFVPCRPEQRTPPDEPGSGLDLRNMVTSQMTLVIGGGSLPSLRMVNIAGIMRVHVLENGDTELRFDNYKGRFTHGLPTGELVFEDVKGAVFSAQKRLLHFSGHGRSDGEDVSFGLDVVTAPRTLATITADFPRVSAESIATRAFALWTKFSPSLELNVHQRR